ncbi:hypothetical protein [Arthrobacter sp. MDT1-65]
MKRSAWVLTAVLAGLALAAGWFFGLDARHAVALVAAAIAAGVANGLLEAVDVPRAVLPPLPDPVLGLADIHSLEFSLASAEPGTRAVLEVHALAVTVAAARPDAPRSDALRAFTAQNRPVALTPRALGAVIDELEQLVVAPPAPVPGPSPFPHQETA